MKKIKFCLIGLSFLAFAACNEEAFLETPESVTPNCNAIYEELTNIRIDKIDKTQYKYDVIDGEKKLVEIVHGASYTTVYYTYQNGHLHSSRGYDRLTEATNSYEEYEYTTTGLLSRTNNFIFLEEGLIKEYNGHTVFIRDEQDRIIERKIFWKDNGVEALTTQSTFEWDDCNVTQHKLYDKNGTLGSTTNFFYDDKVNPNNLSLNLKPSANQSTNNIMRTESMDSNDPSYLHGASLNAGISEYSYTYNEFDLPISIRFNEFDKVDYYYIID